MNLGHKLNVLCWTVNGLTERDYTVTVCWMYFFKKLYTSSYPWDQVLITNLSIRNNFIVSKWIAVNLIELKSKSLSEYLLSVGKLNSFHYISKSCLCTHDSIHFFLFILWRVGNDIRSENMYKQKYTNER